MLARSQNQAVASSPQTAKLPADEVKAGSQFPIGAPLPCVSSSTGEAGAPNLSTLITADARSMSGLAFLDATGMSSPEKRAERIHRDRQACIRAIRNGDTSGFPPMFVADCRRIMAEQPDFDQVDWVQAVRSAYAMPKGGAM